MANKILTLDTTNKFALFILARNEKDIDTKIEKLSKIS